MRAYIWCSRLRDAGHFCSELLAQFQAQKGESGVSCRKARTRDHYVGVYSRMEGLVLFSRQYDAGHFFADGVEAVQYRPCAASFSEGLLTPLRFALSASLLACCIIFETIDPDLISLKRAI